MLPTLRFASQLAKGTVLLSLVLLLGSALLIEGPGTRLFISVAPLLLPLLVLAAALDLVLLLHRRYLP